MVVDAEEVDNYRRTEWECGRLCVYLTVCVCVCFLSVTDTAASASATTDASWTGLAHIQRLPHTPQRARTHTHTKYWKSLA